MKKVLPLSLAIATSLGLGATSRADDQVEAVDRPDSATPNRHYIGNRPPLLSSQFVELPVGAVQPKGWVRIYLERQREGLTGHLGEISVWLQKQDNAWLSKDGKGKYGWEELPYWLKGYGDLGYILNEPKIIAETKIWIEGALNSQRADGDFGPDQRFDDDGTRDYWANMIMLFCLQSYYSHTEDPRVLELMTKYFRHLSTVPDNKLLTHYWQKMRGGDNIYSIYWLYNRTGEKWLLDVATKIHRVTANWKKQNDLPNWHNVNIAQAFREPATYYLQTNDPTDLKATYDNFHLVREKYGQVPGGMYGGDENCRVGYDDPHQGVETCGMVEQMLSDEMLMRITGDSFWGDHCEEVAFNSYPAAVMPDFKALRYLTAPNMVLSDAENHHPGIDNSGPFLMMNPFSSRCCQHNHSHGWPYFSESLWMATPDNGLCAAIYSPNEVSAKVADGTTVKIVEETKYPFEDTLKFTVQMPKSVEFPLYFRIPKWCANPKVAINGKDVEAQAKPGQYLRIKRTWTANDTVTLTLPMRLEVKRWAKNHQSASVSYGPLTYSLEIGEVYDRVDSTKTAIADSGWQKGADTSKWPSFLIKPTTAWNYGLVIDEANPEKSFAVEKREWPANGFPFTPDAVPIAIKATGRKIPNWTMDQHGLCGSLQDSPVKSNEPEEKINLIPMSAARLRIASFPVIGKDGSGHEWVAPKLPKKPAFKVTASHVHDSLDAVSDDLEPSSSADESFPRFTWWDHCGSSEWIQADFDKPRSISEVSVYWFDDTGKGRCRVPKSWKLLFKDGDKWKPVTNGQGFGVDKDRPNSAKFDSVKTSALRIEAQLQPDMSGGIHEWRVGSK